MTSNLAVAVVAFVVGRGLELERFSTSRRALIVGYRTSKRVRGECRDCKQPVAVSRRGKFLALCQTHLDADRARKARS